MNSNQQVVLVDEKNTPIGTADKDTVHTKNTPLHRGFSLFVFNSQNQLLVTKRAKTKKAFPGVWTNTVCGHPSPNETNIDAAKRRLRDELGIVAFGIREVAPYRYHFADANGIVENEICPILVGYFDGVPSPDQAEVNEWKWVDWKQFISDIRDNPSLYSPWSREEAEILTKTLQQEDQAQR